MTLYKLPKQYSTDFQTPNKKPIGDVEIDWSNPLTKGLIHYYKIDKDYGRDLVAGGDGSTVQGTPPTITPTSIITSGASNSVVNLPINISTFDGFGIIIGGNEKSGSVPLSILANTIDWNGFYLGSLVEGRLTSANSFDGAVDLIAGTIPKENNNTYTAYSVSASDFRGAANGGVIVQDTAITIPAVIPPQISLGGSKRNIIDNLSVTEFLYVGIYNRKLSDLELKELSSNPYQILKPKTPPVYFTSSGIAPSAILTPYYYTNLLAGQ